MKGTDMTYTYDVGTKEGERAMREYFERRDEWGFTAFKLLGEGKFQLSLPDNKVPPAGVLGALRAV